MRQTLARRRFRSPERLALRRTPAAWSASLSGERLPDLVTLAASFEQRVVRVLPGGAGEFFGRLGARDHGVGSPQVRVTLARGGRGGACLLRCAACFLGLTLRLALARGAVTFRLTVTVRRRLDTAGIAITVGLTPDT